jgi:transmembrane sensor
MMKEDNSYIDDLIIRYLSGDISPEENIVLSDWVHKSSDNQSYFRSFKDIWLITAQSDSTVNQAHFISRSIQPEFESLPQISNSNKRGTPAFIKILKIAAVVVAAVLIGTLGYRQLIMNRLSLHHSDVVVEALLGSRAVTTLPDGTRVWLNGGSKLIYNSDYNEKVREVSLTGEAFFNVMTNPAKPFIVKAGKLAIKALGTSFNVKAYPDDKSIITTLVKGKVTIEGKDSNDQSFVIQMNPKETITVNKSAQISGTRPCTSGLQNAENQAKNLTPEKLVAKEEVTIVKQVQVNTELYTSWKDERWVIEKQNLETLAQELERRFNIKISISSANIKKFHFTGTIQNETIEQIMVIMRHTIPLKYKIGHGTITIEEDPMLMKEFNSNN